MSLNGDIILYANKSNRNSKYHEISDVLKNINRYF